MSRSGKGRGRRGRPLLILFVLVASGALVVTTGVAASQEGQVDGEIEPADRIIVDDDRVVLVYESEEEQGIVESDVGMDTRNGLAYGSVKLNEDELDFDGTVSSERTAEAFTSNIEGSVAEPESVEDVAVTAELVQSDSENRFDATVEGIYQRPMPVEGESSGTAVVTHDQIRSEATVEAESFLLTGYPAASISADVTETETGFSVDVGHVQEGPDLAKYGTEPKARQSLGLASRALASEYGGTANVTMQSHQFTAGEELDRVEMEYTVEFQGVREGLAAAAIDRFVAEEDVTSEQRDALERALTRVELERLSVDVEKTTDGVLTTDVSVVGGNYTDGMLSVLRTVQADDETFTDREFEKIAATQDAAAAADLSQKLVWDLRLRPEGSGVGVSADLQYETAHWRQFVATAREEGVYMERGAAHLSLTAESVDDKVRVESDLLIESNETEASATGAPVTIPGRSTAETLDVARFDVRTEGTPEVEFGLAFADRHGPMRALGSSLAVVDRHGPRRVDRRGPLRVDRHGPMRALGIGRTLVDRHGPMKVDRHGPLRVDRHGPMKADRHGPLRVDRHGPVRALGIASTFVDRHGPLNVDRSGPLRVDRHGPMRITGIGNETVPVEHLYVESDGDTARTYVHLGVADASEQQLRASPVANGGTEFLTAEEREPQYLDVEAAGEYLDTDVVDPSVRPPELVVEPGTADEGVSVDDAERTIDFGERAVGEEGHSKVTVRNAGGGTLGVTTLADGLENFEVEPRTLELGGGEAATVSVVYAPTESGNHSAGIGFEPDSAGNESATFEVTGEATPPPEMAVDPRSINFDEVAVGETATETVTIENEGEGDLEISALELRDDDVFGGPGDDQVSPDDPLTVRPGETHTVDVAFTPETDQPRSTSLVIRSNDPVNPNSVVYVTSTNVEATVKVDEQNRMQMNATAEGASPENPAQVEMPDPVEDESYETDSLSVTPTEETDIEVDMTSSSKELDTTPESEEGLGNGTEQMGNISVDANVDNEQIQELEFQTRVDTEQLAEMQSDPGNVSLYRYSEENDEWVEKETEVVGQENGETILRTTADGASEWTAAAKTPAFDITETNIDVTATTVGDDVTIQVLVTNTGGTDGSYEAELLLDEEIVDQQERTVPNGGTVGINFERSFEEAGLYTVEVNDIFVGEVNVSAATEEATVEEADGVQDQEDAGGNAETTDEETAAEAEESPDNSGPGFDVVAAVLALLAVVALTRRE